MEIINQQSRLFDVWLQDQLERDSCIFDCQQSDGNRLLVAANYSVLAPGKRFRPVLSMLCADVLGLEFRPLIPFFLSLEYMHASTLVHDDLPALDDDDLRRGRPTCHKAFDEATAILAGDVLLSRSFGLVANAAELNAEVKVNLLQILSDAYNKLCIGQMMDLSSNPDSSEINISNPDTPNPDMLLSRSLEQRRELLKTRHIYKTGALIIASVVGPSYLLNSKDRERVGGALSKFGEKIGLLFQIRDDILDVVSNTEQLGKAVGADMRQGTETYVSLYGLDGANKLAKEIANEAIAELKVISSDTKHDTKKLQNVAEFVLNRDR